MKIDEIIHSNRKTFAIELKPDGRLIVRAPNAATRAEIDEVILRKADWIQRTRKRLAQTYPNLKPPTFKPGEKFLYLGEQYPLQLIERQHPALELDGAFLLSRAFQSRAKKVFTEWYREETRAITRDLVDNYTKQFKFKVRQVRITSARTRWGSCSGKNNLNFTYRLAMAPLEVIEYVVVHELTHLKFRNHSRDFWQMVEDILPDYREKRAWLQQHGPRLTLD